MHEGNYAVGQGWGIGTRASCKVRWGRGNLPSTHTVANN